MKDERPVPRLPEDFPLETPIYHDEFDPFYPELPDTYQVDDNQPVDLDDDWNWREPDDVFVDEGMWPWPEPAPRSRRVARPKKPEEPQEPQ
ncbi:MAG: hypothetical protein ACOX3V_06760 [Bacillota bacterium]